MSGKLIECYHAIPADGAVLDVGCFGFRQMAIAKELGLTGLRHSGVDYCVPDAPLPEGFEFRAADLNHEPVPFADDRFDLVVLSHVLEHIADPVAFFGECVRVCKPGGILYVEAPSERSLWLPGMPFAHEKFFSLSFYDDPTHLSRPWPPQALHRLSRYYYCEPLGTGYLYGSRKQRWLFPLYLIRALLTQNGRMLESSCWGFVGWSSYLVARKPATVIGKPRFMYYIPADR